MIPKNTAKIIMLLLRNLNTLNLSEITKKLNISLGSASKILNRLEEMGIVQSKSIGNAKYFNLNLHNPEAVKICELLLLEEKRQLKGYARLYSQDLEKFEGAELIILFGSILRGDNFNDVDVLFVTPKVKKVSDFCLELSKVRTKPVVPLILRKEDFVKEIKEKKEVILSIIREGVILKGEDTFIEAIKNAKEQI